MNSQLNYLETLFRTGNYRDLERYVASVHPDGWQSADAAVLGARSLVEQGAYGRAYDLFGQAQSIEPDPLRKILITLQTLSIEGVVTGDMQRSLRAARDLLRCDHDQINDHLTQAFFLRVQLAAAVSLQESPDSLSEAFEVICQGLAETDPFHAALAGRWWISSLTRAEPRVLVAKRVADWARSAGFPQIGAEAWISAAQAGLRELLPSSQVEGMLEQSDILFEEAGHTCGSLFVEFERSSLGLQTGQAKVSDLEALVPRFQECRALQRLHTITGVLATRFDERGQKLKVRHYRNTQKEVEEELGVRLGFGVSALDEIERLRRIAEPVASIKASNRALIEETSQATKATILQSRARAYADLNDYEQAIKDTEAACNILIGLGANTQVSNLQSERALNYVRRGNEDGYQFADEIIRQAAAQDFANGRPTSGLQKVRMRVTLAFQEFEKRREFSLLGQAHQLLAEAMNIGSDLPRAIADMHEAHCLQMRGQIEAAQGDSVEACRSTAQALEIALRYDRSLMAAGCHHMLGVLSLNLAISAQKRGEADETMKSYEGAYEEFGRAATLFESVGSDRMLADALMYQAETTSNAAISINESKNPTLIAETVRLAEQADAIFERRRGELYLDNALENWRARQELSRDWERLTNLFMRIHLYHHPDMPPFWERLQISKARSMMDALSGSGADIKGPESPSYEKAVAWLNGQKRPIALVDWAILGGSVYIMVLRQGQDVILRRLPMDARRLENEIQSFCSGQMSVNIKTFPEILSSFDDLISPLGELTRPEDLLVLCPTGAISLLPIHALMIDGNCLIDRNPIIYVPNHAFVMRPQKIDTTNRLMAVFGDPTEDLDSAQALAQMLGQNFGVDPVLGEAVTEERIEAALGEARIVHYQGHAQHNLAYPLKSALGLYAGFYAADRIVNGGKSATELVVLGACESGVVKIARGSEPSGLTQAFLLRDVRRVISTLWNTHEKAAEVFMRNFYARLHSGPLADVFRSAMIESRKELGSDRIHYWAAFMLTGDWTEIGQHND